MWSRLLQIRVEIRSRASREPTITARDPEVWWCSSADTLPRWSETDPCSGAEYSITMADLLQASEAHNPDPFVPAAEAKL
jgi:hypothetical protein